MKSTGCRDVQHAYRPTKHTNKKELYYTGKQGVQIRGIFEFPSIPTSVAALHVKQPSIFSICRNLELISISYNYHAATDMMYIGCLGIRRCPLFVHLAYQCCCCYSPFLFVCFVGLYAGHPYTSILISFEIFLLSCLCT